MYEFIKELKEELNKSDNVSVNVGNLKKIVSCNEAIFREDIDKILDKLIEKYKDKYVSVDTYKQAAWERDTAVSQLEELGYSLGEKIKYEAEEINEMEDYSLRRLLNMLPEDIEIEINSVIDDDNNFIPVHIAEYHYDKKQNKVYLTPTMISIPEMENIEELEDLE